MKTLFVFPTAEESCRFSAARPDAAVLVCGVGMAGASAALAQTIAGEKFDAVVLAGIAGSYSDTIGRGSVVEVSTEIVGGLPPKYEVVYRAGLTTGGMLPVVSGNTVCMSDCDSRGTDIENMEGAAVFALCLAMGIACCEIRAVSNLVGEPFERWDIDGALKNLTEILLTLKIEKL